MQFFKKCNFKKGFTLAEVLITLGVIGIVAAITLPTLIKNVQTKVRERKIQNIELKLKQGTDLMKANEKINDFEDTMDFVSELRKHMKIISVCDKNNLLSCWPSNKISIQRGDSAKEFTMKNAEDAGWFLLDKENYTDPVGIITGDGTPMILTYNKNCQVDVNNSQVDSRKCIAGIFETNGATLPNRYGDADGQTISSDVIPINSIKGISGYPACELVLGETCYLSKFFPTNDYTMGGNAKLEAMGIDTKYSERTIDPDVWANAYLKCIEVGGSLPSKDQLYTLKDYLFDNGNRLNASKAYNFGIFTDVGLCFAVYSKEVQDDLHTWELNICPGGATWHNWNWQNMRAGDYLGYSVCVDKPAK